MKSPAKIPAFCRRDGARRPGGPVRLLQGLSLAEANAGDLDAAAAHGAAAVRDTESVQTAEAFMANTHVLYAWILEEQDRLAEALDAVGRLASLAGANAESPAAAQIDRWRARAHFAAGHWDEAVVDLDSALRVYDAGLDVWPEPLALRALIAVHRGQLAASRSDLDRFDAALAAGGSCLVLDQPVLARAFLLEAEGQTAQATAEIAQRLFVSCRTVETHVSHTLAKLGCTTRRELIAAMRDRGRR